jgi:hypothetical protein
MHELVPQAGALARPADIRAAIGALEQALCAHPDAVFGDSDLCPVTHAFADGIYQRTIFIPKGTVLTGKLHRFAHPNFLMQGEVIVVTEHGGREHLKAPLALISPPGTKRAIYALEDTIWITVHRTEDTDVEKIEAQVIATDYAEYEAFRLAQGEAPRRLEESTP